MGSNIIAHLIFFFLPPHILHINIPTTTHFEILKFVQPLPHIWFKFQHFFTFSRLFLLFHISLSLSLSHEYVHSVLSLQHCHRMPNLQWLIIKLLWIEYLHVQEARLVNKKKKKKKALIEAADHYKSAYLWASLLLPKHKYNKSDFFFLLSKR